MNILSLNGGGSSVIFPPETTYNAGWYSIAILHLR